METLDQPAIQTDVDTGIRPWSNDRSASWIGRNWHKLGLSNQFMLVAGILLAVLFVLDGVIQDRWFRKNLVDANIEAGAVLMEGIIAPYARRLISDPADAERTIRQLTTALAQSGLKTQVHAVKVWNTDGVVLYATDSQLIGTKANSREVRMASYGITVTEYGDHGDEGEAERRESHANLLEIYIPIFDGEKVIAVGEFYQDIDILNRIALTANRGIWVTRVVIATIGILVLFVLVRSAHDTINQQQIELLRNYSHAKKLARRNQVLSTAAGNAKRQALRANEELLSTIGAEIHDGPVQLLSLAMLNMSEGATHRDNSEIRTTGRLVAQNAIGEAIAQLRAISDGLILPDLEQHSPQDVIRQVISRHERTTGTRVHSSINDLPQTLTPGLKACLYRVVQECLNNSARHAQGRGQKVEIAYANGAISLEVSDCGPGMPQQAEDTDRPRLGIVGARNRVIAFGGVFHIESTPGVGTKTVVRIPVDTEAAVSSFNPD